MGPRDVLMGPPAAPPYITHCRRLHFYIFIPYVIFYFHLGLLIRQRSTLLKPLNLNCVLHPKVQYHWDSFAVWLWTDKNSLEQPMQTKIGRNVEDMCEQFAENWCVDQRLNHANPNPICQHTSTYNPYHTISYTYMHPTTAYPLTL